MSAVRAALMQLGDEDFWLALVPRVRLPSSSAHRTTLHRSAAGCANQRSNESARNDAVAVSSTIQRSVSMTTP